MLHCSALDTQITLIAPLTDGEETDYTSRKKTDLPPELHIIQIYSTVHGYLFFFFNPCTQHGSNRSIGLGLGSEHPKGAKRNV
jgi:hypothetical protein